MVVYSLDARHSLRRTVKSQLKRVAAARIAAKCKFFLDRGSLASSANPGAAGRACSWNIT